MERENLERGIMYFVTEEPYFSEAVKSAYSCKKHNPHVPIAIFSPQKLQDEIFDIQIPIDENIDGTWKSGLLKTVDHLIKSPFENTIFLDSDTLVLGNISEIFSILDYFDMALVIDVEDTFTHRSESMLLEGYYPFNTGMIAWANCDATRVLFKEWKLEYTHNFDVYPNDQQPFSKVLLQSSVRVHTLPSIYNLRTESYAVLPAKPAKIVHGRNVDLELAGRRINEKSNYHRVWSPEKKDVLYQKKKEFKEKVYSLVPEKMISFYHSIKYFRTERPKNRNI